MTARAPRRGGAQAPWRVALVGRGRVGRTLAARLADAGIEATLVRGRGPGISPRALAGVDVVWLTVPDPALPEVEARVAVALPATSLPVVAHASGVLGPEVLDACRARGAAVAAAHPVVSFGSTATVLTGATFVLAGEPRATRALREIVRALGARSRVAAVHGARYHAALALAANGTAALASAASAALVDVGFSPRQAASAVATLLRSVADNVGRVGPEAALTGPIARGDVVTVARHLDALSAARREDYVTVARLVLRVARARGLAPSRARAIAALLDGAPPVRGRAQRTRR